MDQVSAFRTSLGVQQNQIEHAINGLQVTSANLTDTQARLTEVDYAAEMARLTRIQIGQKAASALMAQGNMLPDVILSMLKVPTMA